MAESDIESEEEQDKQLLEDDQGVWGHQVQVPVLDLGGLERAGTYSLLKQTLPSRFFCRTWWTYDAKRHCASSGPVPVQVIKRGVMRALTFFVESSVSHAIATVYCLT